MKFNWGTGLLITFSLFAGGMIYLVTLCSKQNEDLVSTDYYNQEIKYQSRIDDQQNTARLSKPVMVNYNEASKEVEVIFPDEFGSKQVSGSVHFFRPDEATLDFNAALSTINAAQSIPVTTMKKGLWRAQLQWNCNNVSYYDEQNLLIN